MHKIYTCLYKSVSCTTVHSCHGLIVVLKEWYETLPLIQEQRCSGDHEGRRHAVQDGWIMEECQEQQLSGKPVHSATLSLLFLHSQRKCTELSVEDKQRSCTVVYAHNPLPVRKNSSYNLFPAVSLDLKMPLCAVWSAFGSAKLIMSSWCFRRMYWFSSFSNIFTSSGEVFYTENNDTQQIREN